MVRCTRFRVSLRVLASYDSEPTMCSPCMAAVPKRRPDGYVRAGTGRKERQEKPHILCCARRVRLKTNTIAVACLVPNGTAMRMNPNVPNDTVAREGHRSPTKSYHTQKDPDTNSRNLTRTAQIELHNTDINRTHKTTPHTQSYSPSQRTPHRGGVQECEC